MAFIPPGNVLACCSYHHFHRIHGFSRPPGWLSWNRPPPFLLVATHRVPRPSLWACRVRDVVGTLRFRLGWNCLAPAAAVVSGPSRTRRSRESAGSDAIAQESDRHPVYEATAPVPVRAGQVSSRSVVERLGDTMADVHRHSHSPIAAESASSRHTRTIPMSPWHSSPWHSNLTPDRMSDASRCIHSIPGKTGPVDSMVTSNGHKQTRSKPDHADPSLRLAISTQYQSHAVPAQRHESADSSRMTRLDLPTKPPASEVPTGSNRGSRVDPGDTGSSPILHCLGVAVKAAYRGDGWGPVTFGAGSGQTPPGQPLDG